MRVEARNGYGWTSGLLPECRASAERGYEEKCANSHRDNLAVCAADFSGAHLGLFHHGGTEDTELHGDCNFFGGSPRRRCTPRGR